MATAEDSGFQLVLCLSSPYPGSPARFDEDTVTRLNELWVKHGGPANEYFTEEGKQRDPSFMLWQVELVFDYSASPCAGKSNFGYDHRSPILLRLLEVLHEFYGVQHLEHIDGPIEAVYELDGSSWTSCSHGIRYSGPDDPVGTMDE